jgi:hypothetical protein
MAVSASRAPEAHIENTVNQIRQLLAVSMMRLPGGVVLIG